MINNKGLREVSQAFFIRIDMDYRFLFLLFFCSGALADNQDTEFRLQQEVEQQQKAQEEQLIEKDQFLTTMMINHQEIGIGNNIEEVLTALFLAINHKQTDDIERLLAIYQTMPEAEEGMITFSLANIAFNRGDTKKAIQLYEKLVKTDNDFLRGKLDLARLYFFDYQNKESHQLFSEINLSESPSLMEKVNEFQLSLDNREDWHGSFSLGAIYHSNLNQSANKTTEWVVNTPFWGEITTIRHSPQVIKSHGLGFEGALNKYTAIKNHHGIMFKGSANGEFFQNHSFYNEHYFSLGLGYRYKNQRHQVDIYPLSEASYTNNQWYSTRQGIQAEYSQDIGDDAYFSFTLSYKNERYREHNLKIYNGNIASVFLFSAYALPHDWVIFGGLDYLQKNGTEDKSDQYERKGLRLGINKAFDIGLDLTLSVNYRKTDYRQYSELLSEKRHDKEYLYSANLKFPKLSFYGITPQLSLSRTQVKSNVDWLYNYNNHEIGLWFEKRF